MNEINDLSTPTKPSEIPVMKKLSAALASAAVIKREPYNGMYISLDGVLSHAARSLREMASPPDTTDTRLLEDHDALCYEAQPQIHAHSLESLAKHLALVKSAIDTGDMTTVRQFFEIYRFD